MALWLLLEIGTTDTVAARSDGSRILARARLRTDAEVTADEYRTWINAVFDSGLDGGGSPSGRPGTDRVIASTVDPAMERIVRLAFAPAQVLVVDYELRREFELDLPFPAQLGPDRLCNVAGSLTLSPPPFLIVDAGSATTFCMVDKRPAYIGGAISPGMILSWTGLRERAARLPTVDLDRVAQAIGNTTDTQLRSGIVLGHECLIEGMTDRLLSEGPDVFRDATLFATGGCMEILSLSPRFRREPDLTLLGLIRYGQLNT